MAGGRAGKGRAAGGFEAPSNGDGVEGRGAGWGKGRAGWRGRLAVLQHRAAGQDSMQSYQAAQREFKAAQFKPLRVLLRALLRVSLRGQDAAKATRVARPHRPPSPPARGVRPRTVPHPPHTCKNYASPHPTLPPPPRTCTRCGWHIMELTAVSITIMRSEFLEQLSMLGITRHLTATTVPCHTARYTFPNDPLPMSSRISILDSWASAATLDACSASRTCRGGSSGGEGGRGGRGRAASRAERRVGGTHDSRCTWAWQRGEAAVAAAATQRRPGMVESVAGGKQQECECMEAGGCGSWGV
eukprot:288940-Chlamydomonas_euryale.AAC.2